MKKIIKVWVDFGKSFVDPKGSFYCGTTEQQKDRAVEVSTGGDLIIYFSDIHPPTSSEFLVNGGLYPAHNLTKNNSSYFNLEKTTSPQLTKKLQDLVKDKKSGLIVPRHVFFQDYNGEPHPQPCFRIEEIEETFGVTKLSPKEFLDRGIEYVINAKHMFNGVASKPTEYLGNFPGVPSTEMNIASLLTQKYGQGRNIQFDIMGVVMGICVYQTSSGIKQLFPKAEVNIIADACTHLIYQPLGIDNEVKGNLVAEAMCKQVGINYLSTEEYLRRR